MMNNMMRKLAVAMTAVAMMTAVTGMTANACEESDYYYYETSMEEGCGTTIVYTYEDIEEEEWGILEDDGMYEKYYADYEAPEYYYGNDTYTVWVPSGYLAVRTTPCWTDDDSNVIEAMYPGQQFTVTGYFGQYVYGFSESTGNWGYVNADYLM